MNLPKELKYSKEHEWVKLDGDIATVGISDYAQNQLTDIVFVDLPNIGKNAEKNKNLATVESVKSVSDVFSPLDGEIVEINNKLNDAPELINKDCYGQGWIAKIRIKDKSSLNLLMSADDYRKHINA